MPGTDHREALPGVTVRRMFDRIVPRYNLMNRLMTGGMDQRWRREMIDQTGLPTGGRLLDLATGTGDVAFMAMCVDPSLRVVGADFSLPMLRAARRSGAGRRVAWCLADALALPFADASFDAVTSAYLVRNLPPDRLLDGLREQARLVRPGGRLVCLDIIPTNHPLVRLYIDAIIPALGALVAGQRAAYSYLARSARGFKTADELCSLFEQAGLTDVRASRKMGGSIALLVARRPI